MFDYTKEHTEYDANINITKVSYYKLNKEKYDLEISRYSSYTLLADVRADYTENYGRTDDELGLKSISKYYYSQVEPTAVSDTASPEKVKIYPNPASNVIHLELEDYADDTRLTILDVSGKIVAQHDVQNTTTIDIKSLASGTYIYKISSSALETSGKFIKE